MDTKDTIIEYLRAQVAALQAELAKRDNPQQANQSALIKYELCNHPIQIINYGN